MLFVELFRPASQKLPVDLLLNIHHKIPVQAAVLNSLANVGRQDFLGIFQIRNGASHFQNAIVGSGRKSQAGNGQAHEFLAGLVNGAKFANVARPHMGVAKDVLAILESPQLDLPGLHDALPDLSGGFSGWLAGKFFVRHGRHFHMNVNSIEQRPRNACTVTLNLRYGAGAFVVGVGKVAAGTSVHSLI